MTGLESDKKKHVSLLKTTFMCTASSENRIKRKRKRS